MKKMLLFVVAVLFSVAAISQTALYQDDFESYNVGDYIAVENPTWWTTWSGAPGTGEDALISDDYASSPTKSVLVDEVGGPTDLLLKLGNKTSGVYNVNFNMYVPTGYAGYYNIQHMESPGIEWAVEVYFKADGTGFIHAGGSNAATFTYPLDAWVPVENFIDLDNDLAELYINGVFIHTWQWSLQAQGDPGANQLGSVDFFAGADGSDVPLYYFDDVLYEIFPTDLYVDDFESYTAGDYIAVVNPTWWTTWSNAPGTGEDALIVTDYANSGTQSVRVDEDGGPTDLILKLGDKVSGAYEVNFYMYVETGYAGYYNIQHMESPGIEWAIEAYFKADGTGFIHAGGSNAATFTYPLDTWVPVVNQIDLDGDWAELYIDGVFIHAWQWSLQSGGDPGANQLGGVDFFAGADGSDVPKYYFDDVAYIQTSTNLDPIINVTPTVLQQMTPQNTIVTDDLTIENLGASDLEYDISVIYTIPTDLPIVALSSNTNYVKTLSHQGTSADPNARPATDNPLTDDFVLHYDGDNNSAIGWMSAPITVTVAAMFPTNLTLPHAGMMIESVDIYINDMGTDFYLRIYDMGNSYEPGDLLVDQAFTATGLTWNHIVLDNPVYITGADVWVGYNFTQPTTDIFIPGCDAGPNDPNGDFLSTGVGWSHLSNNPDLPYNWNIRANLVGDALTQWLSVDPSSGTLVPGGSDLITATFDATGLDVGSYQAKLRVVSNDPVTPLVDVNVQLVVTPGGTTTSIILDFEDLDDFSLTFDDWTATDVDGLETYGLYEPIEWLHIFEPQAFITFNPASTTPPVTDDPDIQPHDGAKFGACFNSTSAPWNNDWLISPQIDLGINSSMTFWVKSFSDQYGLEEYNVGVSTTGMEPGDFTFLNTEVLEAPTTWTEEYYDLSMYDGQSVYVAINCVSTDRWVFMVDDISVDFTVGVPDIQTEENAVSVFPNPATNQITIVSANEITEVDIYNYVGQMVYSSVAKNTTMTLNTSSLSTGVYFIKVKSEVGITTRKLMIR